jgi:branched-chain amino acid transport system ATP-binding protein
MSDLRITGLGRSFGGIEAVRAVDLAVSKGEIVGVIGPNGAGKTTLFNLLSGHERPDSGRVEFLGRDITGLPPERLAAAGIARTFQHGRVFGNLSVLDNVLVGASSRLRRVRPDIPLIGPLLELGLALIRTARIRAEEDQLRIQAEALLRMFGDRLRPRLHDPAHSLSYANRRRLEIARALASQPHLLLLDEPAAGMNEAETLELQLTLAELKARGQTMLLIEHKLDLVMRLCDRVVVMDDGAIIASGPPDEVRRNPAVIEAYLGHGAAARADINEVPEAAL